MGKEFRTIKELQEYLKKEIADSMLKAGKVAERVVREHVDKDVYQAYSPSVYEATFELRESLFTKTPQIKNNIIEVEVKHNTDLINSYEPNQHHSVVEDYNPQDVSDWIPYIVHEGKTANIWGDSSDAAYLKPRPYFDNAREELEQSKEHVEALKNDLRSKGIVVV